MDINPYRPPDSRSPRSEPPAPIQSFPFWAVGPLTGASVGLVLVTGAALAWALHGYPDFLFRSGDWAFISAIVMSIGGAMFGVPYAAIVAAFAQSLACSIRPRRHFWIALGAALSVSYVTSEISLRRRELVSPILILTLIVAVSFVGALATASRSRQSTSDSQ